jgi:hypothetical protein
MSVVSLQKDPRPEELSLLRHAVPRFMDANALLLDFADTAAAAAALDLVISVDTSVCHAVGAIGSPVWTLIAFSPDWRWMLGRQDTPWYPSMRLFRQNRMGEWGTVCEQVRAELTKLAAKGATKKKSTKKPASAPKRGRDR